jgi:hypothetical protein
MEPIDGVRSKLSGLAGAPLEDDDVVQLLFEVIGGGGGVQIDIDDATRYKLIRRDGKFVVAKDAGRGRPSTLPPRR